MSVEEYLHTRRPELRHRVRPGRYRIPDVAIFQGHSNEQIPSEPPLATIEILSPEDRPGYLLSKLEEYRQWGVPHIWIADPDAHKLFTYGNEGLRETGEFSLPEHGIVLPATIVFEDWNFH